jgi:spore coat protein U-like protein
MKKLSKAIQGKEENMKKMIMIVIAVTAVVMVAGHALADKRSSTMQVYVSAKVVPTCSVTAHDLNFGTYNVPTSIGVDGISTIAVACNFANSYTIDANQGSHYSNGARRMSGGGEALTYDLYTNSSQTTTWGSALSGGTTISGSGKSSAHVIYGKIPPKQVVSDGIYGDVVTVTINW